VAKSPMHCPVKSPAEGTSRYLNGAAYLSIYSHLSREVLT
jgi:hypothetical protein